MSGISLKDLCKGVDIDLNKYRKTPNTESNQVRHRIETSEATETSLPQTPTSKPVENAAIGPPTLPKFWKPIEPPLSLEKRRNQKFPVLNSILTESTEEPKFEVSNLLQPPKTPAQKGPPRSGISSDCRNPLRIQPPKTPSQKSPESDSSSVSRKLLQPPKTPSQKSPGTRDSVCRNLLQIQPPRTQKSPGLSSDYASVCSGGEERLPCPLCETSSKSLFTLRNHLSQCHPHEYLASILPDGSRGPDGLLRISALEEQAVIRRRRTSNISYHFDTPPMTPTNSFPSPGGASPQQSIAQPPIYSPPLFYNYLFQASPCQSDPPSKRPKTSNSVTTDQPGSEHYPPHYL